MSSPNAGLNIRPDIAALEESQIGRSLAHGVEVPDVIGMWVGRGICRRRASSAMRRRVRSPRATPSTPTSAGIPSCGRPLHRYHRDLYGVEIADSRIAITSAARTP